MEKKSKDIIKLTKLLKHWADHNDSHKESFLKWRDIANTNGLSKISQKLDQAIEALSKLKDGKIMGRAVINP